MGLAEDRFLTEPGSFGTVGRMRGIAIMLCVALPLAAVDLYVKAIEPTPDWAYHQRSLGWLALSIGLFGGMVLIARIPSLFVALAAGILAGGVIGNSLSAAYHQMEVPNPLLVEVDQGMIAFNLADVWALSGICLLVLSLGGWLIRNRHLRPPNTDPRSARVEAFRRRVHGSAQSTGGNLDTTSTESQSDRV